MSGPHPGPTLSHGVPPTPSVGAVLEANRRPAVFAQIVIGADTRSDALAAGIGSLTSQGAAGVLLHPGDAGGSLRDELIAGAAAETKVFVVVGTPEEVPSALSAGATGVVAPLAWQQRLVSTVAEHSAALWLTGVTALRDQKEPCDQKELRDSRELRDRRDGPEKLVLEGPASRVPGLARGIGPAHPVCPTSVACPLPDPASVTEGTIEALVTLAVAGGATVLRCGGRHGPGRIDDAAEVRLVRRCADVAAELSAAAPATPGATQWNQLRNEGSRMAGA